MHIAWGRPPYTIFVDPLYDFFVGETKFRCVLRTALYAYKTPLYAYKTPLYAYNTPLYAYSYMHIGGSYFIFFDGGYRELLSITQPSKRSHTGVTTGG